MTEPVRVFDARETSVIHRSYRTVKQSAILFT